MPKSEEKNQELSSINVDEIPAPELGGHSWIQRGTELVCTSCEFSHGQYIPPDHQLYGINEKGVPLIKKIEF